jgi:chitin disaccharide deacetylase
MAADRGQMGLGGSGNAAPTRRIWLCADDYGISPAVDAAIRDLIVRGRINATSVMVVAPSLHRSEALALSMLNSGHSRVSIGLHLTLTAPFLPLSKTFAPLRSGAFLSLKATMAAALLHRFKPAALEHEIRSQLRMFVHSFGRAPDFIDGHQHVHLLPQVRDAVLEVAKEAAPQAWVRQCGRVLPLPLSERLGNPKALLLDTLSQRFRRRAEALNIRTNPAFAGAYGFHDEANFTALFPRFLEGLPDGSLVMCHPGFVDAELQRLDPLTTLREREYAFFMDDSFPRMLAAHGVALA